VASALGETRDFSGLEVGILRGFLNWIIQTYVTDTNDYLVVRQSDQTWIVLFNGQVTTGFVDQNDAIAYAENLNQLNTVGT